MTKETIYHFGIKFLGKEEVKQDWTPTVKEILDANYLNSDQKLKALKQYGYTTDKVNKVEKIKEKISACYWIL